MSLLSRLILVVLVDFHYRPIQRKGRQRLRGFEANPIQRDACICPWCTGSQSKVQPLSLLATRLESAAKGSDMQGLKKVQSKSENLRVRPRVE
jgi:hypothetical protein